MQNAWGFSEKTEFRESTFSDSYELPSCCLNIEALAFWCCGCVNLKTSAKSSIAGQPCNVNLSALISSHSGRNLGIVSKAAGLLELMLPRGTTLGVQCRFPKEVPTNMSVRSSRNVCDMPTASVVYRTVHQPFSTVTFFLRFVIEIWDNKRCPRNYYLNGSPTVVLLFAPRTKAHSKTWKK